MITSLRLDVALGARASAMIALGVNILTERCWVRRVVPVLLHCGAGTDCSATRGARLACLQLAYRGRAQHLLGRLAGDQSFCDRVLGPLATLILIRVDLTSEMLANVMPKRSGQLSDGGPFSTSSIWLWEGETDPTVRVLVRDCRTTAGDKAAMKGRQSFAGSRLVRRVFACKAVAGPHSRRACIHEWLAATLVATSRMIDRRTGVPQALRSKSRTDPCPGQAVRDTDAFCQTKKKSLGCIATAPLKVMISLVAPPS